jgi:hypothetical protein
MEPLDEPGVPVSCTVAQLPRPSRFAEATALEGSVAPELDPVEVDPPLLLEELPPIVNVVLTTGQMAPPFSQDLK